jgi:hypothetical protein
VLPYTVDLLWWAYLGKYIILHGSEYEQTTVLFAEGYWRVCYVLTGAPGCFMTNLVSSSQVMISYFLTWSSLCVTFTWSDVHPLAFISWYISLLLFFDLILIPKLPYFTCPAHSQSLVHSVISFAVKENLIEKIFGFEQFLCNLQAVWHWGNCLSALSNSFHICKKGHYCGSSSAHVLPVTEMRETTERTQFSAGPEDTCNEVLSVIDSINSQGFVSGTCCITFQYQLRVPGLERSLLAKSMI